MITIALTLLTCDLVINLFFILHINKYFQYMLYIYIYSKFWKNAVIETWLEEHLHLGVTFQIDWSVLIGLLKNVLIIIFNDYTYENCGEVINIYLFLSQKFKVWVGILSYGVIWCALLSMQNSSIWKWI